MAKLKTRKAVKKRIRVTKKKKILAFATLRRHMLTDRSSKKKRQRRGAQQPDGLKLYAVKRNLPYGG